MKIVVILGPTGVGKTKMSIELSHKLNAEIINADATQIYKEACIGTAKITEEEKEGIKHHMLDVVSLRDNYTVRDYQIEARRILDNLISENKNVVIVGGSGLYIKALLYNYKFEEENETKNYDDLTNEELKKRVDEIYKENDIHVNNRKRLVRFLSHYEVTGNIIKTSEDKDTPLYNFTLIGLTAPRNELYKQLDQRVESMISNGLINEARNLYDEGLTKADRLIGYKELFEYFKGNMELEDSIELIKQRTRNYAKRQYTWFNNQFKDVKWFDINYNCFSETIKKVETYLKSL